NRSIPQLPIPGPTPPRFHHAQHPLTPAQSQIRHQVSEVVFETMEQEILKLLGRPDYAPANVPELLRALRWPPHRQQELQHALRRLEQAGRVTRTKGNRYIQSREADLVPGRIRINRQGKGFLIPDDANLKEIMIPESATGTALHEDRVLVRRDVKSKGFRGDGF